MSRISLFSSLRIFLVTLVCLLLVVTGSIGVSANAQIVGASTLSGNNPHKVKFSSEYATRVDGVIQRILQR
jgi:hypothetical protein